MKIAAKLSLLIISALLTLPTYSEEKSSPSDTSKPVQETNPPNPSSHKPAREASKATSTESASSQETINPMVQYCRENPC